MAHSEYLIQTLFARNQQVWDHITEHDCWVTQKITDIMDTIAKVPKSADLEAVLQAQCEEVMGATCEAVLKAKCGEVMEAKCEAALKAKCVEAVLKAKCDEAMNAGASGSHGPPAHEPDHDIPGPPAQEPAHRDDAPDNARDDDRWLKATPQDVLDKKVYCCAINGAGSEQWRCLVCRSFLNDYIEDHEKALKGKHTRRMQWSEPPHTKSMVPTLNQELQTSEVPKTCEYGLMSKATLQALDGSMKKPLP
jgi:hypothetical protein